MRCLGGVIRGCSGGTLSLGLGNAKLELEKKQAAAAVGQIRLAHAFETALARHDLTVAQILLTPSDTEERRRHLNARTTISQLIKLGAVPVINENDTVATQEIRYGDNDRLAARVAAMVSADISCIYFLILMDCMIAIRVTIKTPVILPRLAKSLQKLMP